jgi:small-conductance mechanosensitive channel
MRAVAPLTSVRAVAIFGLSDGIGFLVVWLISDISIDLWFYVHNVQDRLAIDILCALFYWRLYVMIFRLFLRPDTPDARIAPVGNADASALYRRLAIVVLGFQTLSVVVPVLTALRATEEVVAAGRLAIDGILLGLLLYASVRSRDAVATWLAALGDPAKQTNWKARLARSWLNLAVPFFPLLLIAQAYGAISARSTVPLALLSTLNVVVGLVLFETVLAYSQRTHRARLEQDKPRLSDVLVRCLRVAVLIAAAVAVTHLWVVNVFGVVDFKAWRWLARKASGAGATIFVAYVAWEVVQYFAAAYAAPAPSFGPHNEEEHGAAAAGAVPTTASRLATLMPVLRVALLGTIVILGTLITLSQLGMNTTPLIAGASVIGLAVSFGSQSLVRDIVSGVFYLADDAFRVGEYVVCGTAKGAVEGFTLRSIKLRHQNGPVHTIPFGQLGQITNFSRDWSVVKFNLRFAQNTDLEKLRKAVKKIGKEMMDDPDLKEDLLEPLKMQGVADITENALVVRFKITTRPINPSLIQRNAIKRMIRDFPAAGIEFANATVAVRSVGPGSDAAKLSAGAAALSTTIASAPAREQAS